MLRGLALLVFFSFQAKAQLYPIVGIEFKPILPSELFNNNSFKAGTGNVVFNIKPEVGYNLGMVIRKAIYKGISLESGITYTVRKYTVTGTDSAISASTSFKYVSYELPIMMLFYIQTGEYDYIDGAFGLSLDFFPSDVHTGAIANDVLATLTNRKYWVLPGLNAAIGYEHRTKTSGYFYFGGSYHRMLSTMAYSKLEWKDGTDYQYSIVSLSGHYFALDFKYFFPVNDKNVDPADQNDY